MEVIKAEFQLEFAKLHDRIAEEVTRTTAQIEQQLSQVRKQLTQVFSKLEQTQLQLDIINKAHIARLPSQTYADAARMTPVSINTPIPSTVRSATRTGVLHSRQSRVPEDHIRDTTPAALRRTIE